MQDEVAFGTKGLLFSEYEGLIGGVWVSPHGCCVLEIHEQSMGNESFSAFLLIGLPYVLDLPRQTNDIKMHYVIM